uniref:Large ribosomal subunit protein mL49 n=1 Tax=Astatotilapia calliptera TaxID=8154 RepID=A0A3P8PU23_ASTCA
PFHLITFCMMGLCRKSRIGLKDLSLYHRFRLTQNSFNILPRVKSSAVERLIPPSRIPTLPKHTGPTPSGWMPTAGSARIRLCPNSSLPYMICSSRHDILIYTDVTNSNQKLTLIWKMEGDIRALEKDVRQYLKEVMGKELLTQVNVITMTVKVKGHFDMS